ncbi:hypothetical protein [Devosia neptuniae]|uniref:hypothetical protein n=1 Tax=Devosia neptuniae TaxID=191302 RepID=UPI0022AFA125|nr:hypothetical protein [Devosia neptuniae]MCZ4346438.1 hypothetical protein [Devosia neptuniae]
MQQVAADAISEHITRVMLRYYRSGVSPETSVGRIDRKADLDLLRLHWSLSPTVGRLVAHIIAHPHETQSVLGSKQRIQDGPIRGRLDARATILHQLRTGNSAMSVAHEPQRSFRSGPNQLLSWVLVQAKVLVTRFIADLPSDATYHAMAESRAAALSQVHRMEAVRRAVDEAPALRRPGASAVREAAKSRVQIYRLAKAAYDQLALLEAGDRVTIEQVLGATLVAPLEIWRRFELSVALSALEALHVGLSRPLELNVLGTGNASPLGRVGKFAMYWQSRTKHYVSPKLEPVELVRNDILKAYGLSPDADRPDLVLVDEHNEIVVAVIEAKFFAAAGDDAWDRLRDATHQIVRYGRAYRSIDTLSGLMATSLVALMRKPTLPPLAGLEVPSVVDFADMQDNELKHWAELIRLQYPQPHP